MSQDTTHEMPSKYIGEKKLGNAKWICLTTFIRGWSLKISNLVILNSKVSKCEWIQKDHPIKSIPLPQIHKEHL